MDLGLTSAAFGTRTQTAISNKNAELRRDASYGDKLTLTDPSGRKHTVVTKHSTTTVTRPAGSKSSCETTPTRTVGSTPLKHTLVREASPKKSGLPPMSKTPSRAFSSPADGQKSSKGASSSECIDNYFIVEGYNL